MLHAQLHKQKVATFSGISNKRLYTKRHEHSKEMAQCFTNSHVSYTIQLLTQLTAMPTEIGKIPLE